MLGRGRLVGLLVLAFSLCACGGKAQFSDASTDAEADTALDAIVDGEVDAAPDAVVDGEVDGAADAESDASLCPDDADGDGEPSVACGGNDCDDDDANRFSTNPEVCNGVDDDCDGMVDEGVAGTFYRDDDGDRFGVSDDAREACTRPDGFTDTPGDCDDGVGSVHPGAVEVCDAAAVDEDCDGVANPATLCACTTGEVRGCSLPGACAAGTESCVGGSWSACSISGVSEVCNGVDDDCDGSVDEAVAVICFADADDDTYAAGSAPSTQSCPVVSRPAVGGCPLGSTNRPPAGVGSSDCNEADPAVHPGVVDECDGVDNDCNGAVDEGGC